MTNAAISKYLWSYLAGFSILLMMGCSKGGPSPKAPDGDAKVLSFRLGVEKNDIPVSSEGTIDGERITLFLPTGTDVSALVPDFTLSDNAKAVVGGEEVISGKTAIDFRHTVQFLVSSGGGPSKSYEINLKTDDASIDSEVSRIMNKYNIPGLQLAITYKDRLVYLKSYGVGNKETGEPVTNESLFRIASVSKVITLVAILKLIDEKRLRFDDKVFGQNGVLGFDFGTKPYNQHVEAITVKHLLEHKSGWTNYPFDPMFGYPGYSNEDLLTEMLDNRPPANLPGAVENYLNFGYFVLARIIEKVTGLPYETYVRQTLFEPFGITGIKVGRNTVDQRYENEVTYYDQENYSPYLIDVTRMDAAGGWVANAADLARLLVRINRNSLKPDVLPGSALNYLYLSFHTWVFNGSMSGTASSLVRINDDLGGAIVVNTRAIPDREMLNDINNLLTNRVSQISQWPAYDLFEE